MSQPSNPTHPIPEIFIRAPSSTSNDNTKIPPHPPPPTTFLTSSPWLVTYSTLPIWRSKRNVKITYQSLPQGFLDDQVTYQTCQGGTVKTVHGVDRPVYMSGQRQDRDNANGDSDVEAGSWAYHWRGKGWLMIASSKWEVLGYGSADGGGMGVEGQSVDWAVTYFAKTLFTPEGIDIYSRPSTKLPATLIEEIKKGLKAIGDESFQRLVGDLFLVTHDEG
ncbi:hypothetical protein DTO271G3_4282 [Paecilomyces variotii]|nr:hypothetical protein DTO271G3_4282 [Paecilomyces variotii]